MAQQAGDTEIEVLPLPVDVPAGAVLDFNGVVAKVTQTAIHGATLLQVEPLQGAIAHQSTAVYVKPQLFLPYIQVQNLVASGRVLFTVETVPYATLTWKTLVLEQWQNISQLQWRNIS